MSDTAFAVADTETAVPRFEDCTPIQQTDVPKFEDCTPIQSDYPNLRRKDMETMRQSFAGDPLAWTGSMRPEFEAAASRETDPEQAKKRFALAAYLSRMKRQDLSFVHGNLDQILDKYYGKKTSVDAAYSDIGQTLNSYAGVKPTDGSIAKGGSARLMATGTNTGWSLLELMSQAHAANNDFENANVNAITEAYLPKNLQHSLKEKQAAIAETYKGLRSESTGYFKDIDQRETAKLLPDNWASIEGVKKNGVGGTAKNAITAILLEAPNMTAQALVGAVNPAAVLPLMAFSTGADKRFELQENNPQMSAEAMATNVIATGLINGFAEKITVGLMKGSGLHLDPETLKAGFKEGLKYYGKAFLKEGFSEAFLEQLPENLTDILTGARGDYTKFTRKEWYDNVTQGLAESFVVGAPYGLGFAGMGHRSLREMDRMRMTSVNALESEKARLSAVENPSDNDIKMIKKIDETLDAANINNIAQLAAEFKAVRNIREVEAQTAKAETEAEMTDADKAKQHEIEYNLRHGALAHNPQDTHDAAVSIMGTLYPGVNLEVVTDPALFSDKAKEACSAFGYDPAKVRGFYDPEDDTVYVNAASVRPSDVGALISHEVVGHKGLQALMGDNMNDLLDGVYASRMDAVERRAENIGFSNTDTDERRRIATEEYLAECAEFGGRDWRSYYEENQGEIDSFAQENKLSDHKQATREYMDASGELENRPAWWREILQKIRMFFKGAANIIYTDAELETLLSRSARAMRSRYPSKNAIMFSVDAADKNILDGFKKRETDSTGYVHDSAAREAGKAKLKELFNNGHITQEIKISFGRFSPHVVDKLKEKFPDRFSDMSYDTELVLNGSDFEHIKKHVLKNEMSESEFINLIDIFDNPVALSVEPKTKRTNIWFIGNDSHRLLGVVIYGKKKKTGYINTIFPADNLERKLKNKNMHLEKANSEDEEKRGIQLGSAAISDPSSFDNMAANSILIGPSSLPLDDIIQQENDSVKTPQEQYDAVVKQFKGTGKWLKAPNGEDTKLTEKQWVQVRTPAFKAWFGDWENDPESASKVVDENGEPMVTYHITNGKHTVFDLSMVRKNADIQAFFFSSGTGDWEALGGRTVPVFLNMRNPKTGKPMVDAAQNEAGVQLRQALQAQGHDGIIEAEEGMETEYAVFASNQIKSATDNTGAFDGNNPDIRFSGNEYSDQDIENFIGAIRPDVGPAMEKTDAEYLKILQDKGFPITDEKFAHKIAAEAYKQNRNEALRRGRDRRDRWIIDNNYWVQKAVEFCGNMDFKIKPAFRFHGEKFTGSFISPEFVKYSEKPSDKKTAKYKANRDKALSKATGKASDELAQEIASKYGGDALQIEQDLIDYFRDLKKKDLYSEYKKFRDETIFNDKKLDAELFDEFMAQEDARIDDEVLNILTNGTEITQEFAYENRKVYERLFQQMFKKDAPYSPAKRDIEAMNAAIRQAAGDAATYAQAWKDARIKMREELQQKVREIKEAAMKDGTDLAALQKQAAEFARKHLPKENRGEFISRIVNLSNFSAMPTKRLPEGKRAAEFNRIFADVIKRKSEVNKENALAEIKEMLDAAKVKRNSKGIPTSVLPGVQLKVNRIAEITRMDMPAVASSIEFNNGKIAELEGSDNPGDVEKYQEDNLLLSTYGALKFKDSGAAVEAAKSLKNLIRGGKDAFRAKLDERKELVTDMRRRAIADATFGANTISGQDAKAHGNFMLKNQNLGTLMRLVSGREMQDFDSSLAGELYRNVEDSTQAEQTGLRHMQNDLDDALRDIAEVKTIFDRGRFLNMMRERVKNTGVMRRRYSRAVRMGENDFVFEDNRRQTIRNMIPIDKARKLLEDIDNGIEHKQYSGVEISDMTVDFLRQQLADYDAGLKQSYVIFGDENDDAAINRMIEEQNKEGRLVLLCNDPEEKSTLEETELSQGAALQILLTWEQDHYKSNMKWNGWDESSIEQLKKFIRPEVLKLGYWMRDYIAKHKPELNQKALERYGAALPDNPQYFPASFREGMKKDIKSEESFARGAGSMTLNPNFLIARKFHLKPVDTESDAFSNFMGNQLEQNHFIAWADTIRDLRSVYGAPLVQKAISGTFGNNVRDNLIERIDTIVRGGGDSNYAAKLLNQLYRYWVPAKIAINPSSAIKQMFGVNAYANHMPVTEFYKYLAQANFSNSEFKEFVKWAKKTDYLKNRLSGALDKDLIYLLNYTRDSKAYSPWSDALMQYGTKPTIWADCWSTLHGGYAVYRYNKEKALKAGYSDSAAHDLAARAWMRATDETQQSGYLKDQNYFQANQGAFRYMTAFLTNPIQIMNQQFQAMHEVRYGSDRKAAIQKLSKMILVNHFIVPTLMQFTNDMLKHGLNIEDYEFENYFVGWLMGCYDGLFIGGKLAGGVLTEIADLIAGRGSFGKGLDAIPLFEDLKTDASFVVKLVDKDEITEKDVMKGLQALGDAGMLGGLADSRVGAVGMALHALGTQGKRVLGWFGDGNK